MPDFTVNCPSVFSDVREQIRSAGAHIGDTRNPGFNTETVAWLRALHATHKDICAAELSFRSTLSANDLAKLVALALSMIHSCAALIANLGVDGDLVWETINFPETQSLVLEKILKEKQR